LLSWPENISDVILENFVINDKRKKGLVKFPAGRAALSARLDHE